MPQFIDRIRAHQVNNSAQVLAETLQQSRGELPDDAEAVLAHERLTQIVSLLQRLLREADANLLVPGNLDAIHQYISNVLGEVRNFASTRNASHLYTANTYADSIVSQFPAFPRPLSAVDLGELTQTVNAARSNLTDTIANMAARYSTTRAELDGLTQRVGELTAEIDKQKARLDTAIVQYQEQFSRSEAQRLADFTAAEQKRAGDANSAAGERDNLWANEVAAIKLQHKEQVDAAKLAADTLMGELEERKQEATRIVGIISENGLVHGYRKVADAEAKSAENWHKVAAGAMIALILFALFAFWGTIHGETVNWGVFAARAFVAAAIGILAAYAARLAGEHRDNERRNRRLELELAALDPFLAPLPEEKRLEVKRQMADKLFGQVDVAPAKADRQTTGSVADVAVLLAETVRDVVKK